MLDKVLISSIPIKPGVYFLKKQSKIIYIGKAKSLKKRIASYFQKSVKQTNKTKLLIRNTDSVDWMICKAFPWLVFSIVKNSSIFVIKIISIYVINII